MTNRADQIGTREWLDENNRRVIFQQHMYNCAGRQNPDHPMHGLFTGLWHDFCLNEAGKAQRDGWFDRMEFVKKVESGEIEIPKPHYYNPEGVTEEPSWAKNMTRTAKIKSHLFFGINKKDGGFVNRVLDEAA